MPVFELKPWEGNIELEVCGAHFCFELRDKEHSVYASYEEFGERGGIAVEVNLQKREGYREYVRRFIELDLPGVSLDSPNETNGDFYTMYKSTIMLYKERKKVSLHTSWESGGINASFLLMMLRRSVDVTLRATYGPHRLHYDADATTKKAEEATERLVRNAIGLYALFKEYIRGGKPDQGG